MHYAVRHTLVLTTFVLLSLFNLYLPTEAQQPAVFDARVLDAFTARNIGPANMGGRIVALAVPEGNDKIIYVGTASGGLFKSSDAGDTYQPIFDNETSICIGDVAVAASNHDVVWVGTGEHNARNSVAWGDGVYKSTDGGKTWQHMGLKDSHSIGRIAIHPRNPDIVYVAVLGHIWGPNKERGIFKTTDGGKTWQTSKYIDENHGFIDLKMDPENPDTLYAACYSVRRDAFSGGNPATFIGPKAGLYKTTDGGKTWDKMTEGLPTGRYGRCGFDIYRKDTKVVYAVVQSDKTPSGGTSGGAMNGKGGTEDGGVYRSDDGGKSWKHLNTLCPRPFYFGQIRVDPNDDKRIYVLGVTYFISDDAGKTFKSFGSSSSGGKGQPHADHHALWVNPKNSDHVILGNDGGLDISTNRAKSWEHIRRMSIGQFYGISVDMRKPYYVHGGLQDNGCWMGPSANYSAGGIRLNEWRNLNGGDGFHTACDPTDPYTVYVESQYGKPKRLNVKGGGGKGGGGKGMPVQAAGPRFNWSSPMILSPHDPKTVFYGGNNLIVSHDRGDSFKKISTDLTYLAGKGGGGKGGAGSGAHSLFTIGESPKKKGVLWTGADDGCLQVSKDMGETWTDVSTNLPGVHKDRCISRVEPSAFEEGTCYVSLTRYRNDDRKPYVFKTADFGATWTNITNNLPVDGSVHVIIESNKNKNLLFVGTEFGLFVSVDGGAKWLPFKAKLPTVAVHDVIIHPRDRDLVVGTHGRSIYIIDNISPLEEQTPEILAKPGHLFGVRPAIAYKVKPSPGATKEFTGENPPYGALIRYHLKNPPAMGATIAILDATGKQVAAVKGSDKAGLHQVVWNLRATGEKETVRPGDYQAVLDVGGEKLLRPIRVEAE